MQQYQGMLEPKTGIHPSYRTLACGGGVTMGSALCHLRGHPPPTLVPPDSATWKEKGCAQMSEMVGSRGARTKGLYKPPSPPH